MVTALLSHIRQPLGLLAFPGTIRFNDSPFDKILCGEFDIVAATDLLERFREYIKLIHAIAAQFSESMTPFSSIDSLFVRS